MFEETLTKIDYVLDKDPLVQIARARTQNSHP